MNTDKSPVSTVCPDCHEKFTFQGPPKVGEKVMCPNCWAYLEIVGVNPLKLQWDTAELEEEDLSDE